MPTYIKLFTDYDETFDEMSDTEAGRLIKALIHYGASGEMRTLSGGEKLVFGIIKRQIDRDNESAEAHREAGKNGGRPKTKENQIEPNETKENQNEPNRAMNKEEDNKTIDKEKDNKTSIKRFTPPTADEVSEYCKEKGYKIDAEHFVSYYESNGWKVGRNPMKDWRAACRTWARNEFSKPQGKVAQTNYSQREYEETKPGELPDWYVKMLEDEQKAQAAEKAGINPMMPQWLAEDMVEEAMS